MLPQLLLLLLPVLSLKQLPCAHPQLCCGAAKMLQRMPRLHGHAPHGGVGDACVGAGAVWTRQADGGGGARHLTAR